MKANKRVINCLLLHSLVFGVLFYVFWKILVHVINGIVAHALCVCVRRPINMLPYYIFFSIYSAS